MLLLLYKWLLYQCPVITVATVYGQCPGKTEGTGVCVCVQYVDWNHV